MTSDRGPKKYGPNYTTFGSEYGKDASGNIMSQYGVGHKGRLHRTHGGHTTLHPDGNNHHHDDHALGGNFSKDGTQSWKRRT